MARAGTPRIEMARTSLGRLRIRMFVYCLFRFTQPISKEKIMSTPTLSLGYVILYVKDVSAALSFYEEAFGLSRRFFHDDNGKAYGELETGAARLAFASFELAKEHLKQEIVAASPNKPPLGFEIALVTP